MRIPETGAKRAATPRRRGPRGGERRAVGQVGRASKPDAAGATGEHSSTGATLSTTYPNDFAEFGAIANCSRRSNSESKVADLKYELADGNLKPVGGNTGPWRRLFKT